MEILGLRDQSYDVGKCVVFAMDRWDGTTDIFAETGPLIHIGANEGEVRITPNSEYSELTIPEALGPAALKRYHTGTRPTFNLGRFAAEIEQIRMLSPTGIASVGNERQVLAKTYTFWLVPETLFLKPNALGFSETVPVFLSGGVWLKDGSPLSADDQRLLDLSILAWKCDAAFLSPTYKWEEGGKALSEQEITVQQDLERPNGCQQYLYLSDAFGDYPVFTIDFEPVGGS